MSEQQPVLCFEFRLWCVSHPQARQPESQICRTCTKLKTKHWNLCNGLVSHDYYNGSKAVCWTPWEKWKHLVESSRHHRKRTGGLIWTIRISVECWEFQLQCVHRNQNDPNPTINFHVIISFVLLPHQEKFAPFSYELRQHILFHDIRNFSASKQINLVSHFAGNFTWPFFPHQTRTQRIHISVSRGVAGTAETCVWQHFSSLLHVNSWLCATVINIPL